MQTNMVNFRADDALVVALGDAARRSGLSVSELIREAVRQRVYQ
jgi:predicted HicB family RNase H-like nuclease